MTFKLNFVKIGQLIQKLKVHAHWHAQARAHTHTQSTVTSQAYFCSFKKGK